MKCEVCLKLLEEYIDDELGGPEGAQVSDHLITCVRCASEFDSLTAEQEIYSRYDRALDVVPSMWNTIAARTALTNVVVDSGSRSSLRDRIAGWFAAPSLSWSLAGAVAVLIVAAVIGVAYLRMHRQAVKPEQVVKTRDEAIPAPKRIEEVKTPPARSNEPLTAGPQHIAVKQPLKASPKTTSNAIENGSASQSDVLSPDIAYSPVEEQETQTHIEQAQNLLRSVRNIEFSEDDTEIDVTYEKALSRQLLNENVILRRDAEMSGKFPVKTLLSSLEPFLLDIANLPDKTSPEDLRVIKERVEKTEIVAALHGY